ncbi:MAG: DUF418 domain-containing protein [Chloroflexota bacterium]
MSNKTAIPTQPKQRVMALDALRGFAMLGILIVNIGYYAGWDGWSAGDSTQQAVTQSMNWVNPGLITQLFVQIFADSKFITIFSLLFGSGIAMIVTGMKRRGLDARGLHYRRQLWLLVIGLVHFLFIWDGDILMIYAISGMIVYLFHTRPPRQLLTLGIVGILFAPLVTMAMAQISIGIDWSGFVETTSGTGNWLAMAQSRLAYIIGDLSDAIDFRIMGLMLAGMALYQWGVVLAQKSLQFYRSMAWIGLGMGLPLAVLSVLPWVGGTDRFAVIDPNYWGSLFMASGYIGLIMLIAKTELLPRVTERLAAVGRMALTNYLMQSILCALLMYDYGLGLGVRLGSAQQLLIVGGVWALQLWWSPLWLRHFRFGPFEWIWRSLTYMKLQPIRIQPIGRIGVEQFSG